MNFERDLKYFLSLSNKEKDAVYEEAYRTTPYDTVRCIDALYRLQLMYLPEQRLLDESPELLNKTFNLMVIYWIQFYAYAKGFELSSQSDNNFYIKECENGLLTQFGVTGVLEAMHVILFKYYKPIRCEKH